MNDLEIKYKREIYTRININVTDQVKLNNTV